MELWIAAFVIASVNAFVFLVAASLALYRTRRQDRRPVTNRGRTSTSVGDRRGR